jgi:hypothetical protein
MENGNQRRRKLTIKAEQKRQPKGRGNQKQNQEEMVLKADGN